MSTRGSYQSSPTIRVQYVEHLLFVFLCSCTLAFTRGVDTAALEIMIQVVKDVKVQHPGSEEEKPVLPMHYAAFQIALRDTCIPSEVASLPDCYLSKYRYY